MWNLPAPPGFRGFDPYEPVRVYQRHLPHWRQDGATYFVTFRLHDSLPQNKLHELDGLRAELDRRGPSQRSPQALEQYARKVTERIEAWLDQGMGSCVLKVASFAKLMFDAMHYFDGARYELGCHVVMPNHVHAIVRPLRPDEHDLEDILATWKKFTSRRIHDALAAREQHVVARDSCPVDDESVADDERRDGSPVLRSSDSSALWQDESFDRIIRDEEHLWRAVQYIGRNPAKANLSPDSNP